MNISVSTFNKYFKIIKEILKLRNKLAVFKSVYYSFKFRGRVFIGKNSVLDLGSNARIIIKNNGCLKVGVDYALLTGTTLHIHKNGKLIVNGWASFMRDSSISVMSNAVLEMGHGSYINEQARVKVQKKLRIGKGSFIAWRCNIIDSDVHKHAEAGMDLNKIPATDITKEIYIGDHVWIGGNCTILKGVAIGSGAVIGAGSVISKNIPPKVLAVGNPCRVIKENYQWKA